MKKYFLLAICVVLAFGCAKKGVVRPDKGQETAVEQEKTQVPQKPSVEEPSVRFSDWESVPEMEVIHFEFDKSELNEEGRNILKRNSEFMKSNADLVFLVEGNCDERGTVEYNLGLGQRRAMAVREYYGRLGIPLDSVGTISYGSEKPAVMGSDENAWAKNRRAETKARSKK